MQRLKFQVMFLFILLFLCLPLLNAYASAPPTRPVITKDTIIVSGATLSVEVEGEEAISGNYIVTKKGEIHLVLSEPSGKFIQEWDVAVKNMTSEEARLAIVASLKIYLKRPVATLKILDIPHVTLGVYGEVAHTGTLRLPPASKLSDALTQAQIINGGDISQVYLRRERPDKPGSYAMTNYDLTQAVSGEEGDPTLRDGDKIYVWRRPEEKGVPIPNQVRVIGEVKHPDGVGFEILIGMRVIDAINACGGLSPTADRSKIYLGRRSGETLTLRSDKLEARDAEQNVELKPGDLLIVNRSDRSQVFAVMGEVGEPRTFQIPPGGKIKASLALQLAGGFSKKADTHKAMIAKGYLLNPTGATPIPFDPEMVKQKLSADPELEAGDVLFIEAKKRRPNLLQQILPLALRFILPI